MGKMIRSATRETNADSALVLLEKRCCSANGEASAAGISLLNMKQKPSSTLVNIQFDKNLHGL